MAAKTAAIVTKQNYVAVTLCFWRCINFTTAIHTHRSSVHQAAKLVATLLRPAMVTAGLAESNGSLPPGL